MSNNVISINDHNFKHEVIDYSGLVLVDFWAKWCEPCKTLMPHIEQLAKDKKGKIKVCKFNVEEGTEVPSKYGIKSIPTLIVFKDGKEIIRKIGATSDSLNFVDSVK